MKKTSNESCCLSNNGNVLDELVVIWLFFHNIRVQIFDLTMIWSSLSVGVSSPRFFSIQIYQVGSTCRFAAASSWDDSLVGKRPPSVPFPSVSKTFSSHFFVHIISQEFIENFLLSLFLQISPKLCFKNFLLSFLCKYYLTGIYRKLSLLFLLQITPKLCVSKNFLLSFMCKHYLTGIYRKLSPLFLLQITPKLCVSKTFSPLSIATSI